jgi:hypothetical protein
LKDKEISLDNPALAGIYSQVTGFMQKVKVEKKNYWDMYATLVRS